MKLFLIALFVLTSLACAEDKKVDKKERPKEIDIEMLLERIREIHEAQQPSMDKVKNILHGKKKKAK